MGALSLVAALFCTAPTRADDSLPSVFLEELTWTEVYAALVSGHVAVILPTGGTEQNGPHAVLGKHNFVVRETSERIARELGGILVAPVMAYVPEGDPGPEATGHMRWPGTLSVPDSVFAEVLEAAVRSLRSHGFREIYLIGDSGGNQAAQKAVAERLTEEWRSDGVLVLQVSDYYAANGQVEWLRAQGFSDAEIGRHAALRDTSELMAVRPDAIRPEPLAPPEGAHPGNDGEPGLANAEIGEQMLTLKVQAAVRQISAASQRAPAP